MKRYIKYLTLALLSVVSLGCIENDIPYPVVKLEILGVEAEGLTSPAKIDVANKSVTLEFEETTDIRNAVITDITVTEGATTSLELPMCVDLRIPLYVDLSMHYSWEWSIVGKQNIERYFRVEGQIGDSTIDSEHHIATALVPMDFDLTKVNITALKLGPKDITTYSTDPKTLTNFENTARYITVRYHNDISEDWTLRIIPTDVEVSFKSVDAWAKRIWLYAEGRSGAEFSFKYRKAGSEEWITVQNITVDGGSFSACVEGLDTLTDYEVIAYSNDSFTPIVKVTTEDVWALPNAGFEEWSVNDKGVICPYLPGAEPFWGTGNDGAAIASTTLTEATEDTRPGSTGEYAAALQSKKAAVMGLGKFAAGNIFLGEFGGLVGMDGLVNFGRPSTARPVALRGWIKYNCGAIDEYGKTPTARPDIQKGDMDEGQIMIAVGNWTAEEYGGSESCPVVVNTKNESTFLDPYGKNVIGSGVMILKESTNGWKEFTLPLEYATTSETPTHIIIVCTGSRFGDYFTGSTQSLLLVDDFELIY
ncbi:MAG: PCMD domain-containing protein [Alistipes sp.]|nr:PCMD domain-containing protein [Alistipes sp.]